MPNIATGMIPVDGLTPSQAGVDAAQRAGYRIGAEYNEAGGAVARGLTRVGMAADTIQKHIANQEITQGMSAGIKLFSGLDQSWNQLARNANPNDNTVAPKFMSETAQPQIEKFVQSFDTEQGRQWAQRFAAQMTGRLNRTMVADTAQRSADAAVANVTQFANHASTLAYENPGTVDTLLGQVDHSVQALIDSTPNLSADAAEKLRTVTATKMKESLVTAAFKGLADHAPAEAQKLLDSGRYAEYLNGGQAAAYLRTAMRTQALESRLAQSEARAHARDVSNATASQYLSHMVGPDGQPAVPAGMAAKILQDPSLEPTTKQALLHETWAIANHDATAAGGALVKHSDPAVYGNLMQRAAEGPSGSDPLTLPDVLAARNKGLLSDSDFHALVKDVTINQQKATWRTQQKDLQTVLGGYKHFITGTSATTADPRGDQRFYEFTLKVQQRFARGIEAGIPEAKLLDPNSPEFVARDVSRYMLTNAQAGTTAAATAAANSVNHPNAPANPTPLPPVKSGGPVAPGNVSEPPAPTPAPTNGALRWTPGMDPAKFFRQLQLQHSGQ